MKLLQKKLLTQGNHIGYVIFISEPIAKVPEVVAIQVLKINKGILKFSCRHPKEVVDPFWLKADPESLRIPTKINMISPGVQTNQ